METFSRYWPFVWGIHLTKASEAEAGKIRRHRTRYDVIVMQ